ncbi:MAG TPA: transcription antitermination factor NusB [Flavobacteriaceae bacterium]|nr:transcription antitermination factor NusB [Flavobacteriaceae bacterium]
MLTRRHIRVKAMQSLYAIEQAQNENLSVEEKFLLKSMEGMYDLFLLNLSLFVEIKGFAENFMEKSQKKHLATSAEKNPNRKFVENRIIQLIENSEKINLLLEQRKLNHWKANDEYVAIIWEEIKNSDLYQDYLESPENSFERDKNFIIAIFKEIIAPNPKLYEFLEDNKLTWLDDLPIVNTIILKIFQKLKPKDDTLEIPRLFKNIEDKEFAVELFRKTFLNNANFNQEIRGKTPNWDTERIAEIDTVLLKMAICEFLKFPSIPVKVTINEYLEIAKEYSTPKSSIFINGVLDKISKEYQTEGKLNKMGRGLM